MTALNTRNLDEPADSLGLFTTLLDRFGALGGVELDLPRREGPARAADFLLTDRSGVYAGPFTSDEMPDL